MATPISELDLPTVSFDFAEAEEQRNALLALSKESWIAKGVFAYPIFKYEDCVAILRDKRWHSAAALAAEAFGVNDPRLKERRRESILSAEGDVHTRLRRLVAPSFSPRAADRLRPFMREVMNSLIDPVAKNGMCDLATDICDPYPIPIICELLGAPKKDWQLFSRWAEDVLRIFNATASEELDVIFKAQDELGQYTRQLIADRRSRPADDLITSLIAAEEAGDKLDEAELEMMVEAVIVGGTDTTRNQLGLALAIFAEHPEQWEILANDPSLAPRAVEEVMRFHGAVGGTIRFASEDIEYNGVLFPKGTFMSTSMATGNFDASVFPTPEKFDITREPVGQPHLSLGAGIHYCLGASLARAELQEAFILLSQRMPKLALNGPVEYKPTGVGIFGPASLPVRFDPGH
jgi:cytochrome P450